MVLYTLYLKADLDGVESLELKDGADICLDVRNPVDHQEVRERIVVDSSDLEPAEEEHTDNHHHHHSKQHHKVHPCHFSMKWRDASSPSTIRVVEGSTRPMLAKDTGIFVPMLQLECDGLEPYNFHALGKEFVVTNQAGAKFPNADLSPGDWTEFDLGSGSTSVLNLQAKFE